MNPALKLVIFEQKEVLQELLNLLDKQYDFILSKDVINLDKIASEMDEISKKLATIELRRRNLSEGADLKKLIEDSQDNHIKDAYENIKIILTSIQLQKETNETLIKQNLFFTNKMLSMIKIPNSTGTYNSYGKMGK